MKLSSRDILFGISAGILTTTAALRIMPTHVAILLEIPVFLLAGAAFSYIFRFSHPGMGFVVAYIILVVGVTIALNFGWGIHHELPYNNLAVRTTLIALQHAMPGLFLIGFIAQSDHKKYPTHGTLQIYDQLTNKNGNVFERLPIVAITFCEEITNQVKNATSQTQQFTPEGVVELFENRIRALHKQLFKEGTITPVGNIIATKITQQGLGEIIMSFPDICSRMFTQADFSCKAYELALARKEALEPLMKKKSKQ